MFNSPTPKKFAVVPPDCKPEPDNRDHEPPAVDAVNVSADVPDACVMLPVPVKYLYTWLGALPLILKPIGS